MLFERIQLERPVVPVILPRPRYDPNSEPDAEVVFQPSIERRVIGLPREMTKFAPLKIISIGTLNASLIHPRETFRTAILKNCASVIVVHNHPSGSLEPSNEDLAVTKRLKDAGKLLGIEVLDHVIVTADSHKSFKEQGLI